MSPKNKRLSIIIGGLAVLGGAMALVLSALNDNIVFFYGPSELAEMSISEDQFIRIGGLVEPGTVEHEEDGQTVHFVITDGVATIPVSYNGQLPDLFREGQGVVAQGNMLAAGRFQAREILAKHDENYMPPEVAEALKRSGEWRPEYGAKP